MKNVTIYTKDYCPYCKGAKRILGARGIQFNEIDVEFNQSNLSEMMSRSGRRTVPQIFFENEHIGGYDDLVEYFANKKAA